MKRRFIFIPDQELKNRQHVNNQVIPVSSMPTVIVVYSSRTRF